jgi:hypothetical protein
VGTEAASAVRAVLGLININPLQITIPLLAAAIRAVLGGLDFSVHLSGYTGCYKTALATLIQQMFGRLMDANHVPANWSSTANALEELAHAAKDVVLVVDDFCPTGPTSAQQQLHHAADRLLRGAANHSGRQRLTRDAAMRAGKPPRGLLVSTGEAVPKGQSLVARLLNLEPRKEDMNLSRLTACQRDAAAGLYASGMASCIAWLAPQYESVRSGLRDEVARRRAEVTDVLAHARTFTLAADLLVGWEYLLRHAYEVAAVSRIERDQYLDMGRTAIAEVARRQAAHHDAADPVKQFLSLLAGTLVGGRAHLTNHSGGEPANAAAFGWVRRTVSSGAFRDTGWESRGERIGWLSGDDLYLDAGLAYAAAQRLAYAQGAALGLGQTALYKAMNARGLLVTTDERRRRLTVRKTNGGVVFNVLHLNADLVMERTLKVSGSPGDPELDLNDIG